MVDRLAALAVRVEEDPDFLAMTLAVYARSEGFDDAALAARLGCDVRQLTKLRLCRRPRSEPERFQADVMRIASAYPIDRDVLLEALRRADALAALRDATHESGFLMAARDRIEDGSRSRDEEGTP
jgi:hypothetical protein